MVRKNRKTRTPSALITGQPIYLRRANTIIQRIGAWSGDNVLEIQTLLREYVETPAYLAELVQEPTTIPIPTREIPCRHPSILCMDEHGGCLRYKGGEFQIFSVYDVIYMYANEENLEVSVTGKLASLVRILGAEVSLKIFRERHGLADILFEFAAYGHRSVAVELLRELSNPEISSLLCHHAREVRAALIPLISEARSMRPHE